MCAFEGLRLVLGCNGFCWIGLGDQQEDSPAARVTAAYVANAALALSQAYTIISLESITAIVEVARINGVPPHNLQDPAIFQELQHTIQKS